MVFVICAVRAGVPDLDDQLARAVRHRSASGFDNFRRLLDDERFWQAVQHHGVLLLALPLITIAIALFFAFLLNVGGRQRGRPAAGVWGSKFYRVVFFFPQVLAVAIIAVLFQTVYRPERVRPDQRRADEARAGPGAAS